MENYRPFENQILILFDANIRLVTDFQSKAKIFNCLYIRDIEVNHCGKVNYGVMVQGMYQNWLPYSRNHNPLLIKNFSWILNVNRSRIFWRLLENKCSFENWLKKYNAWVIMAHVWYFFVIPKGLKVLWNLISFSTLFFRLQT